eukprot:7300578-Lingulodinium_polyedra.AAC.1
MFAPTQARWQQSLRLSAMVEDALVSQPSAAFMDLSAQDAAKLLDLVWTILGHSIDNIIGFGTVASHSQY